jgi:hypothetical protein
MSQTIGVLWMVILLNCALKLDINYLRTAKHNGEHNVFAQKHASLH